MLKKFHFFCEFNIIYGYLKKQKMNNIAFNTLNKINDPKSVKKITFWSIKLNVYHFSFVIKSDDRDKNLNNISLFLEIKTLIKFFTLNIT